MTPPPLIPISVYAVAAYEAARLYQEDPADLFDPDYKSRARYVAIEVVKRAFPACPRSEIARCFAMEGTAELISSKIAHAKTRGFWNEKSVSFVEKALSAHLRRPVTIAKVVKVVPGNRQIEESQFDPGAKFIPRKIATRLTAPPARSSNVTAYLMGDPGAQSARIDRGEASSGMA